jgi:hypothetical protein
MLTQSVSHVRQKGERVGPVEAFLVRRVEAVRLIVIGVQPDWHLRCVNAANGTSCWKVDGRLLDEIGRTSYVLERLLRVDLRRPPFVPGRPQGTNRRPDLSGSCPDLTGHSALLRTRRLPSDVVHAAFTTNANCHNQANTQTPIGKQIKCLCPTGYVRTHFVANQNAPAIYNLRTEKNHDQTFVCRCACG